MTDKRIIIDCKYKFQNNEKFEGKPYCTLHNELCEDLSFACDDNCQVFEDYRQLKRKEQSEARLVKQIQTICDFINNHPEIFKGIYGDVDKIIIDYAERKEQECEELKNKNKELIAQCFDLAYKVKKVEKTSLNYQLAEQLNQLKAENEEYKKNGVDLFEQLSNGLKANEKLKAQKEQAEQKLEKIREVILNFSRQDIITLPDFEPIKNYEFIQKQCNKPILEVLQIIDEVE